MLCESTDTYKLWGNLNWFKTTSLYFLQTAVNYITVKNDGTEKGGLGRYANINNTFGFLSHSLFHGNFIWKKYIKANMAIYSLGYIIGIYCHCFNLDETGK